MFALHWLGAATLVVLATQTSAKLPLPSYLKPCSLKLSRPDLEECAKNHAIEAFPQILNGDKKYRVPSLNPLRVERLEIDDGTGGLGLKLVATDAKIYGLEKARIDYIEADIKGHKTRYDMFIPSVKILSRYNMSGQILVLPVQGEGDAEMSLDNMYLSYRYSFELKKRADGETYFVPLPHDKFEFNTTRLHTRLDNLFNGDKLLGENTNKFLDENWEELLKTLGPVFSTAISNIIHNILTNIFELVPFNVAFLDAESFITP